jgi:putative photosynthetic complex assembly protein 2
MAILLPVLATLAVWWASTGVILLLDRLPRAAHGAAMAGATALLALGLAGIVLTAEDTGVLAAYLSFGSGLLVWAWAELAFLTGTITGARRVPCPVGVSLRIRFGLAARAVLHHELAILALGLVVFALSWQAENAVGAWTYAVLWVMRLSAKLNIFLGVRNFGEALLPHHLHYLTSYFRRARMNPLFPFSVAFGLAIALWFASEAAGAPYGGGPQTGLVILATLASLAVVEHVFLLLPVPLDALWTGRRSVPAEAVPAKAVPARP